MNASPLSTVVIVSAYQEEGRLGMTLSGVAAAFEHARVLVADDGSRDGTPEVVRAAPGVELVRSERTIGKGGAMTLAARRALETGGDPLFVLCDGDLGESARDLGALADPVRGDACDLAVARFARKVGGGFGLAVGFSRWATVRRGGPELQAPISGQRAMRAEVLRAVLPFAPRFGMETAMNIDAARAGYRICEVELPLAHRATGRTLRGFLHRGRQLKDFALVYASRR